jgi:hypothetical protein
MFFRSWLPLVLACLVAAQTAQARELHVSTKGQRQASGSVNDPFASINQAAFVAQPGDTVIVHEGTYREYVKPPRGGTGENNRITYRAASGEDAVIKGSERITTWQPESDGVWKVQLPYEFFGDYNPYYLRLDGGWLNYGKWHHRGDVYLNQEAFYEKETAEEVHNAPNSWHCRVEGGVTTIRANFGKADPNTQLSEINVRESIFFPQTHGLNYITVDGFTLMHSAENWQPPRLELQMGAIGTRMGKHWIIQNLTVVNARCVGIMLGHARGGYGSDDDIITTDGGIEAFGDHIVRNNIIRRCGQAGIAGQKGATRSLITGNLVEDTNYRKEFGGWETAGIKFHNAVDVVISNNLIRGVRHQEQAAYGIWIDMANQGFRITGNIIYDTDTEAIFMERDHGPSLLDHNIIIGKGFKVTSESNIYAHNLCVDCGYNSSIEPRVRPRYYTPHTANVVGQAVCDAQNDKWFNNIFVGKGLETVKAAEGSTPAYASDYNVFLAGAKKGFWRGDEHSVVDSAAADVKREDSPLGVRITFNVNGAPFQVKGPVVDARLAGVYPVVKQTIEDRYGKPVTVDTDINGRKFGEPLPGPVSDLKRGLNTVTWSYSRWR